MKKYLVLTTLALIFIASFAQDSSSDIKPAQPSATEKIESKADSFFSIYAAKHNIDTNASAAQIGEMLDEDIKLIPGKHAGPIKWLGFLAGLLGTFTALYFVIKHGLIKGINAFSGNSKTTAVIILAVGLLGIYSCTVLSHSTSATGGQVTEALGKKGITATEFVNIHTGLGQNDTAALYIDAPDTIGAPFLAKVHSYVQITWPGHTAANAQQNLGNSWYVVESIRLHSGSGLRDTASFVFIGNDTTTNAVFSKFENFVAKE